MIGSFVNHALLIVLEGWLSLAKSTRLLNERPRGHVGSNPSPSAKWAGSSRGRATDF